MSEITGRIWKYGDNVNTDVIFPGKYTYTVTDPGEMAKLALEDLDPEFSTLVQNGDIVLGGKNFGCGSSREQAAFCLKYAGVGAVIAKSFSRLYYRNCINAGLPALVLPKLYDQLNKGDRIEISLDRGVVVHKGVEYHFPPLPGEIIDIFNHGGLIPHIRKILKTDSMLGNK